MPFKNLHVPLREAAVEKSSVDEKILIMSSDGSVKSVGDILGKFLCMTRGGTR